MRTLLTEAFRRLEGKSEQAVFKLTQSMGGGKTHNLTTLGMLAIHPEFRAGVLPGLPSAEALPKVRVIAFSGRETDVPHGIWGEIARQLGKQDAFAPYYSPLQAPGRTAWINLLKGEPTLILLDELPPYLDNAKSIAVGSSDLSRVTATALTNLFEAVAERELGNVCVVLTDLVGTYAEASAQIATLLRQLQDEAQRHAMNLTPVQINTDEFYHILRKRLFKSLPKEPDVAKVAQAYASAVREAKQMDITAQSPEQFAQLVQSSYPFHPAIKDLYARFRENQGFQQTRALIRLMRIIAARLWQSGEARQRHLISVHDIDLNDAETLSEIRQINPSLENAVSHDIAAQGKAVAEIMDQNLGGADTLDACRLIFMASLANVPNAILGLSIPELVGYLCTGPQSVALEIRRAGETRHRRLVSALQSRRQALLQERRELERQVGVVGAALSSRAVAQGVARPLDGTLQARQRLVLPGRAAVAGHRPDRACPGPHGDRDLRTVCRSWAQSAVEAVLGADHLQESRGLPDRGQKHLRQPHRKRQPPEGHPAHHRRNGQGQDARKRPPVQAGRRASRPHPEPVPLGRQGDLLHALLPHPPEQCGRPGAGRFPHAIRGQQVQRRGPCDAGPQGQAEVHRGRHQRHLPQEDRGPVVHHARHALVGGEEAGRDQPPVAVAPPRRPGRHEGRSGAQGSLARRQRRLRRSLPAGRPRQRRCSSRNAAATKRRARWS